MTIKGITSQVAHGPVTVIEYQPGNGSRYVVHLTDMIGFNMEGNPRWTVALLTCGSGTAMTLSERGYLDPTYVAEKLRVGMPDAIVLTQLIAHVTGRATSAVLDRLMSHHTGEHG